MGATLKVLTILLTFGYISSAQFYDFSRMNPSMSTLPQRPLLSHSFQPIWSSFANNPFPAFSNYDQDAEVFTPEQRTEGPNTPEKPFEVDVITSDVPQRPSLFPFFDIPIFSSFGGFGFESGLQPWWKGENVCTMREEDEELATNEESNSEIGSAIEPDETPARFLSGFHFSLKSCVEKHNKYICTRTVNQNGKKKTLTVRRECCHGYGRPRNSDPTTPCSKIEIKSMEETAADMGVKEFINNVIRNGLNEKLDKNITLFAPIDRAFTEYGEKYLNENNLVSSDQSGIAAKSLIQSHLVDGLVDLDEISNEKVLKTKSGESTIRINAYQMPFGVSPEPVKYTANCVPILKHDRLTDNGLLHTVENLILPVQLNVMQLIENREDMSVMQTVLKNTNLSKILEGSSPVTIFVPTDSAFEKLDYSLTKSLKEGKGCALNMMKSHILDLTFCSAAAVAGTKTSAYNLLGERMMFNRSSSTSEVSDLSGEEQVMINGFARVVESDIMGTNGVLHVIDKILPTPTAMPVTALMKEKNSTVFEKLIEAAGVKEEFDEMDNVTVLAPTDKAFQGSEWAKALKEEPETLRNNQDLISFLKYHVFSPKTKTCDLSEKLLTTEAGSKIRVNLYSTLSLSPNVMNRATVNCARLVHFDDESCGSVLHQVDKILTPPQFNLLEMLESNGNYTKFLELVKSANLTSLLEDPNEAYTLLIPKNDVFEEMEGLSEDKSEVENLIKRHIVNDVVCCAGIIRYQWPFVRTIETLNGSRLHIKHDERYRVENAAIIKCDKVATNGIIHEINDILIKKH